MVANMNKPDIKQFHEPKCGFSHDLTGDLSKTDTNPESLILEI